MSKKERAKPLRQKKIIFFTLTWHKTCGFPTTTSSAWARVIATLNLLGLLRKPTVWRTSTPTNDSLDRTCNQSQHSRQSGLIHLQDYLLSIQYPSSIMPLVVHADLIANADGLLWKRIPFKTFFHSDDIENGVLLVWKRIQSVVDRIMWTTDENTWKSRRVN